MTVCTFDGVTVPSRTVTNFLVEGDHSGNPYRLEIALLCRTTDFEEYTALAKKFTLTNKTRLYSGEISCQTIAGTLGSLVLNGTTYTNCYIDGLSALEMDKSQLGVWDFTISFSKDTSV